MEVGVAGLGFVGKALLESFESRGQTVVCYDKYKEGINNPNKLLKADIIFLCLPTPYLKGCGFNLDSLHEVCEFLFKSNFFGLVVIKSTVEPGTTSLLAELYQLNMVHNPEFLTARKAFEDFDNQKHIVIGESRFKEDEKLSNKNFINADKLFDLYRQLYPKALISRCSSKESEAMKLFCNNFYAAKVQIFNEFYLLCEKVGIEFEIVKNMMLKNDWINPMHTSVPGPDGKLSYGGMCFPKDVNSLNEFMKEQDTPNAVLEAVMLERNIMRNDEE